jgi:hypothetical protein
MRLHAGRSNPSRPIPILPCDAQSYTAVTQREGPDYTGRYPSWNNQTGGMRRLRVQADHGTTGDDPEWAGLSFRSLPGVLGEPLARGTVTVGDSRPAARSKASKRHPSTGNLSGKAFDRPSDRRRSYGPAGGPGPAPAGRLPIPVPRRRACHRARTSEPAAWSSYLRAATAGLEGSAQKIDFLKRHDLTACDIPTCRAHSGDHNAPWYTVTGHPL